MSGFLLALWLRSILLGAAGLAAVAVLRKQSASVRHFVAVSTLAAILALPFLGRTVEPTTVADLPSGVSVVVVPLVSSPSQAARIEDTLESRPPIPYDRILLGLWLAGVVIGSVRIGRGLWELRRHVRHSNVISADFPVRDSLVAMTDPMASVPMTAWWGKHRILLPPDWDKWPEEQVTSALRHEEAHIARQDWFVRLGCQVVGVIFWPNPLVASLNRMACALAEQAADDGVLRSGVAPWNYAQSLLQIAKRAQAAAPVAAIPLAEKAEVARRIEMILEQNRIRRAVSPLGIFAIASAVFALAIPMASWAAGPIPIQGPAAVKTTSNQKSVAYKSPNFYSIQTRVYRVGDKVSFKGEQLLSSNSVLVLTGKNVKGDFLEAKLKDLSLICSPSIHTLDGQVATITYNVGEEGKEVCQDQLTVTPTMQKRGKIKVVLTYNHGVGKEDHVQIKPLSFTVESGGNAVIIAGRDQKTKTGGVIVVVNTQVMPWN